MFFLVEGYHRSMVTTPDNKQQDRIVGSQAVMAPQLGGTILRMMQRLEANVCVVTEISEDVFTLFYQEEKRNRGRIRSESQG